jgi:hypothetical protein
MEAAEVGGFVHRTATIGITITLARPQARPPMNWVRTSNTGNLAACAALFMAASTLESAYHRAS